MTHPELQGASMPHCGFWSGLFAFSPPPSLHARETQRSASSTDLSHSWKGRSETTSPTATTTAYTTSCQPKTSRGTKTEEDPARTT